MVYYSLYVACCSPTWAVAGAMWAKDRMFGVSAQNETKTEKKTKSPDSSTVQAFQVEEKIEKEIKHLTRLKKEKRREKIREKKSLPDF